MSQLLDSAVADPQDGESENNPLLSARSGPHADGFGAVVEPERDRGGSWGGERPPTSAAPDGDATRLTARDLAVLRYLVLLRLLRYDQLHRVAFAAVDRSIARRRLRQLARAGWVQTWEAPTRHGGHARYAHPTARTLRAILPTLVPTAAWAPLVATMIPRSGRRPLDLGVAAPKWLAHQREVNHVLASIVTAPRRRTLWASSWDCPFPPRAGMLALPQPDYVLVEERAGAPQLIFGEHDRGSEPLDRFTARKVALYSALAAFPEVCERQFGFRTFRVHVTVIDPVQRAPIVRLRALLAAARASARPDIFRFALGGWLYAYPDAPVWFRADCPPAVDAVALREHAAGLVAA